MRSFEQLSAVKFCEFLRCRPYIAVDATLMVCEEAHLRQLYGAGLPDVATCCAALRKRDAALVLRYNKKKSTQDALLRAGAVVSPSAVANERRVL